MMQLADLKKDLDLINSIDWEMTPEEAVELAKFDLPDHLKTHIKTNNTHKGIYALEGEAKKWLREELDAA
jgi:hypothetical protein